jgi:hypothetical protein
MHGNVLMFVTGAREKKDLEKMWQQAYLGMCNRAVVLNHVILKAEQAEATVKPVSILNSDTKRCAKPTKSSSVDKHYVGLGRQFYHVDEIGEVDSSQEELDLSSPRPHKRTRRKKPLLSRLPCGLNTVVCEIPKTEEVDLSYSEESCLIVRLHLRSRSVLVHEKRVVFTNAEDESEERLHNFEERKPHSLSHQSSLATSSRSIAAALDSSPVYSWLPNKIVTNSSRIELKTATNKSAGKNFKNFF